LALPAKRSRPDDFVVQNTGHGQLTRQRVAKMIRQAAVKGDENRIAQGLPPLPAVTPHSPCRTYISIALLANRFDVKWVMSQVGHADSKMMLDVYAQFEQRIKREHGVRFDALVRSAEPQLHGAEIAPDWETSGRRDVDSASIPCPDDDREDEKAPDSRRFRMMIRWRDPDSNRGHHDFCRVE
jgi:hypothetical protein